jgi:hypothetical protein
VAVVFIFLYGVVDVATFEFDFLLIFFYGLAHLGTAPKALPFLLI